MLEEKGVEKKKKKRKKEIRNKKKRKKRRRAKSWYLKIVKNLYFSIHSLFILIPFLLTMSLAYVTSY